MATMSLADDAVTAQPHSQEGGGATEVAAEVLRQALQLVCFPQHPLWEPRTLDLKEDFAQVQQQCASHALQWQGGKRPTSTAHSLFAGHEAHLPDP